jgi:hypothetical protein
MSYNLFLDDDSSRMPHEWGRPENLDWEVVRSYNAFIRIIKEKGLPKHVSFDHDLTDAHYQEFTRAAMSDGKIRYNYMKEKTGYHACKWLVEYCLENKLPLPECNIHTMNPIGRANIQSLIDSYRKVCNTDNDEDNQCQTT